MGKRIQGISDRLEDHIENYAEYSDDGDGENGPSLSIVYNTPDWIDRIIAIAEGEYPLFRYLANY